LQYLANEVDGFERMVKEYEKKIQKERMDGAEQPDLGFDPPHPEQLEDGGDVKKDLTSPGS